MNGFDKQLITVFAVIIASIVYFGVKGNRENDRLDQVAWVEHVQPIGVVSRVFNCYSGKHRYTCTVDFTNGARWGRVDVTDYPDETFAIGNSLVWSIRTQENRQQQVLCDKVKCSVRHTYWRGKDGFEEKWATP